MAVSSSAPSFDYLLACLSVLSQHFGVAKSPDALISGLAVDRDGISEAVFMQAAQRIGLEAHRHSVGLKKVATLPRPLVLCLKNKRAGILKDINKQGAYVIYDVQTKKSQTYSKEELAKQYDGCALTLSKASHLEKAPHQKHWFWKPFWSNAGLYRDIVIASVLINLFGLVSPIFIMNVYDRVIPNNTIETGWVLGGAALIIFSFDFIIRTLREYFIDFAGARVDVAATQRIYDQVLDMKLSERPRSSGATANMLKDFDSVRDFMTSATVAGLVDLPFTLFFLFIIFLIGGPVAVMMIALIVVIFAAGLLLQIPLKHNVQQSMQSAEAKHGLLVESIHGLETIKAIGADQSFRARYHQNVAECAYWAKKSRFFSAMSGNIATWVQQSASIIIVLMGMYMVRDQSLSMGGLIACVILSGRALAPIAQMANLLTRYHQVRSSMRTINTLMAKKVDRPEGANFLHRHDLKGKISFDKVSFEYPGTDRKVLDQVSFTIQPGEKVGLIGRIGSGKSTIARLMMDLYDPSEGIILFDDTDERQIDPADLRAHIGYISQDVTLFSGTVRDNLIAGQMRVSEDQILDVARKAGVHEFISRHPLGYDARIGERGEGLSGGQRQAIALARAMLRNPSIYVCDEPTNAMDVQSEAAFHKHMQEEAKDKTLVLITHRQPLLAMVDRLILLEQGRVIADGPRADVLKALAGGQLEVKSE